MNRGYPGLDAVGAGGAVSLGITCSALTRMRSGVSPVPSSRTSWVRSSAQNPAAKWGYRWQWKIESPIVPAWLPEPNSRSAVKASQAPKVWLSIAGEAVGRVGVGRVGLVPAGAPAGRRRCRSAARPRR